MNYGVRVRDYPIYKVVVSGEPRTGKTALLKLANGEKLTSYRPTVGIDFHKFQFEVSNHPVRSIFFDMGGEKRFKDVREPLYRGTRSGVIVYDVSRPDSLLKIVDWYKELREKAGNVPVILVGIVDPSRPRKVSKELGEQVAKKIGATYLETNLGDKKDAVTVVKEAILAAAKGTVVAH